MIRDFRRRFWVGLVLTVPILLLSPMIQNWLGISWQIPGQLYWLLGLSTTLFAYGGFPFLKGWWKEMRDWKPGMMTLIGLAISVAYVYSAAVVLGLSGKTFFWELATLVDVMLLGHWIEMKSVLGASRALEKLMELLPDTAHRLDEQGNEEEVSVSELREGDLSRIKPGEKIPADGDIEGGSSDINESMLTGESKMVEKKAGDEVFAGSVNGGGALQIRVSGAGEATYLSKVVKMVRDAQSKKSKTQRLADKAALWLTIVAIGAGLLTLGVWLAVGYDFAFALERMVTVMVICCPHALGLAIPLVAANSTSLSAQNGLLIRNRTAFESARQIDTIVFDKTGTLTTGTFGVTRFGSLQEDHADEEVLRLAASLEQSSEHPLARGILEKAKEKELQLADAKDFRAISGKGVEGTVDGVKVEVVSPGYLEEKSQSLSEEVSSDGSETIVFVLREGEPVGFVALADQIRPESKGAIKTLHDAGIKTVMLTGDNRRVAEMVAGELGMDDFFAEVLPEQKLEKVKELQAGGAFVAMTGDGVNDAPALAQADVGIAIGSGTDVAAETADIILVESDPRDVVALVRFGRSTFRKMVQNLIWATAYNVVALPLAAGVLYQQGILISPAVGAALMSLSTVIVAINAQSLKWQLRKN